MALKVLRHRLLEQNRDDEGSGGGGGGDEARPPPAEINARGNNGRLARMEEISRVADGRRAREFTDVDGDRVAGRFAGGEFDDSAQARERAQEEADELERQTREEAEERARESQQDEERERARALQGEGADNAG